MESRQRELSSPNAPEYRRVWEGEPEFKPRSIEGWFEPPDGIDFPQPGASIFSWDATLPLALEDEIGKTANRSLTNTICIHGVAEDVVRKTPPPAEKQTATQPCDRLGTPIDHDLERDFLVAAPANDWKPFKGYPDSRERYTGIVFPEPTEGWTNDPKWDFRRSVLEHWRVPRIVFGSAEIEEAVNTLWFNREWNKTLLWVLHKLPPGAVFGMNPTYNVEEVKEKLLRMNPSDTKCEWEFREVEFGESNCVPPQKVPDKIYGVDDVNIASRSPDIKTRSAE